MCNNRIDYHRIPDPYPVCIHCGSGELRISAIATWSFERNWIVERLLDDVWCNHCCQETEIRWERPTKTLNEQLIEDQIAANNQS